MSEDCTTECVKLVIILFLVGGGNCLVNLWYGWYLILSARLQCCLQVWTASGAAPEIEHCAVAIMHFHS